MPAFLDSSALIKYFSDERGSKPVRQLIDGGGSLWVSELAFVECVSAIAKKVRRSEISEKDFAIIYRAIVLFFSSDRCIVLPVNDPVKSRTIHLLSTYGLKGKLDSLDAVQLATAIEAREIVGSDIEFHCADRALIAAATNAVDGLIPVNPEMV